MNFHETILLLNIRTGETLQVPSVLLLKLYHSIPHRVTGHFHYYLLFCCGKRLLSWPSLGIAMKSQKTQQLATLDFIRVEIKDWIY